MMTLLKFVVLLFPLLVIRIPTFTIGGAEITTAGGVPIGAGTIKPVCEPGGAGTKTPSGPCGRSPRRTPLPTNAIAIDIPKGGATKSTSGAAQKPLTNTTAP